MPEPIVDQPVVDAATEPPHPARIPWRGISVALGIAFGLMVAALGVYAVTLQPLGGQVRRGYAIDPGQVVAGTNLTSPSVEAPSPQPPEPVPPGLRSWSVSNAGAGSVFALGAADCSDDVCPVLLRSSDDGTSWNAVQTFNNADTSSARGDFVPSVQPDRAITQTRFLDPQRGYVFGGDLWLTRDRGQTFSRMPHVGQTVLDVAVDAPRNTVAVLASDGCVQGTCTGPIYLSLIKPSDNSVSGVTASLVPTIAVSAGSLVLSHGKVFVQVSGSPTGPFDAYAVKGGALVPMKGPTACRGTGIGALTGVAGARGLYAVCAPVAAGDRTSYTVIRSDNDGGSWAVASVGALVLPAIGQVSLAAPDPSVLVAASGGPRGDVGFVPKGYAALVRSDNAGRTFSPPTTPPTSATGFDDVIATDDSRLYAIPRTTSGYWTSDDDATTWRYVDPAVEKR
ncbi:hypothetical protein [Branchiibius sp. NY16-3462-2]|uniref:hypothetical protein n=1 Tax=Branchiibius sp. NY16-3462-2 TaxID=1807500 RepID=UPI000B04EDE2|nr:hypothetical protein [Branchiibius sp. NY16-3462-2]